MLIKLVADAIAGLAPKGGLQLDRHAKQNHLSGGRSSMPTMISRSWATIPQAWERTLSADQFTLDYDFSAPADAAKVTVTLKSNPNVTETYTVAVTARVKVVPATARTVRVMAGLLSIPYTGDGDKTNGANGNKATGVLSKTGSAVTAVGLAVVVLGAAGGVSFALRRKRS